MKNFCLIIGFGKTGKSAYNFLLKKGYTPILFDDKIFNNNVEDLIPLCDFVLPSPGVSNEHKLIKLATELGVPVLSATEIMFCLREQKNKIVGITGTNGKTTVTTMVSWILEDIGISCGNIGKPWMNFDKDKRIPIIELSSFELDRINKFKPNIFAVLNIAPDHLSFHKTMNEYVSAKLKPIRNMDECDFLIYGAEDEVLKEKVSNEKIKKYYFAKERIVGNGVYVENGSVIFEMLNNKKKLFSLDGITFNTHHNLLNILAATLICCLLGVDGKTIKEKLISYKYEKYRMEEIAWFQNVKVINDSKSTNLASTLAALSIEAENIILLVGGRGKGEDYSKLFSKNLKIKQILLFGESAGEIEDFATIVQYKNYKSFSKMEDAVCYAFESARSGDVILFSPGCASFDEFNSYEERGFEFNKLAENYIIKK